MREWWLNFNKLGGLRRYKEPNALVYCGFKEAITNEEFAQRIQNKTLLEVLNKVEVKKR